MANKAKKLLTTSSLSTAKLDPNRFDKAYADSVRLLFANTYVQEDGKTPAYSQASDELLWQTVLGVWALNPNAKHDELLSDIVKRLAEVEAGEEEEEYAGDATDQRIIDAVRILNDDDDFISFAVESTEAWETVRGTPTEMLVTLLRDFATVTMGDQTVQWTMNADGRHTMPFACATIDGWPVVGSKAVEGKPMPNTGYDISRGNDPITGKNVPIGFYKTMIRDTIPGRRNHAERIELRLALQTPAAGKYAGRDEQWIKDEINRYDERDNYLADNFRDAVNLVRQMQAVNAMEKVRCYLITREVNIPGTETTRIELTPALKKICIEEKRAGGVRYSKSIGEFLNFSVEKATKAGGTITNLMENTKREVKPRKGAVAAGQGKPDTASINFDLITFPTVMEKAAVFANSDTLLVALAQRWNDPDHTKSDAAIKACGDFVTAMAAFFIGRPDFAKRYDKLAGNAEGTMEFQFGVGQKPSKMKTVNG